jgi:hypothetical protein
MANPYHITTSHKNPTLHLVPHKEYAQSLTEMTKREPQDDEENLSSLLEIDETLHPLVKFIANQKSSTFKALPVEKGQTPVFELQLNNISLAAFYALGHKLCGHKNENFPLEQFKIVHENGNQADKGFNQGIAYDKYLNA